MNEQSNNAQNPTTDTPPQPGGWTPGQIAAVVILTVLCAVLVWNAYSPEDIYLSDLTFEVLEQERFEMRKDTSVEGDTIAIDKTYYPKGVGVHANSTLFVRFIPHGYRHFVAEIGIDKEVPPEMDSSVVFSVIADGTLLYESPVLKQGMPPRLVHVPIAGRKTLTLNVTDAGDGNEGDRANWAMARFIAH